MYIHLLYKHLFETFFTSIRSLFPRIGILLNDDDYSFDQTKALKKEVRKAKKAITLAEK